MLRSLPVVYVYLYVFLVAVTPVLSQKINQTVNATEYSPNSPAKLQCVFPSSVKGALQWSNHESVLKSNIVCKTDGTCDKTPGYQLSRTGNTITLIIEHVDPRAPTWTCSDILLQYTETVKLNIIVKLGLSIIKKESGFHVNTSCSLAPLNLTCAFNDEPIKIEKREDKFCTSQYGGSSTRKHLLGFVNPASYGTLKCTVTRGSEVFTQTYKTPLPIAPYIVGAIVLIIGVIFAGAGIFIKNIHVCLGGVALILIGIGVIIYAHTFEGFIALIVIGSIVVLLTILHLIYAKLKA